MEPCPSPEQEEQERLLNIAEMAAYDALPPEIRRMMAENLFTVTDTRSVLRAYKAGTPVAVILNWARNSERECYQAGVAEKIVAPGQRSFRVKATGTESRTTKIARAMWKRAQLGNMS